jgi:hypothetical protein
MGAIASTMVLKEQLRRLRNKKRVGVRELMMTEWMDTLISRLR